jgi:hypothetical protein
VALMPNAGGVHAAAIAGALTGTQAAAAATVFVAALVVAAPLGDAAARGPQRRLSGHPGAA